MRRVNVFNNISLDGFIADSRSDMSWAHQQDPEWHSFSEENAAGGDVVFLFGRVTYELMASFWPSPAALQANRVVADVMNGRQKLVFSRTLERAAWQNTAVLAGDPASEVRRLKQQAGPDLLILGSGSIVSQLAQARLIDSYQVVLHPIVLGSGKSMFASVQQQLPLKRTKTRSFQNGNVVLWYEPA